jgi:hypothetical protein
MMKSLSKAQVVASFTEFYRDPGYGPDETDKYYAWVDYTDLLVKDGLISEARKEQWDYPF